MEVDKGRGVVLRATDHKLPQQKPLEAVRTEVIAAWKKQRGVELAAAAAADAVKRLTAGEVLGGGRQAPGRRACSRAQFVAPLRPGGADRDPPRRVRSAEARGPSRVYRARGARQRRCGGVSASPRCARIRTRDPKQQEDGSAPPIARRKSPPPSAQSYAAAARADAKVIDQSAGDRLDRVAELLHQFSQLVPVGPAQGRLLADRRPDGAGEHACCRIPSEVIIPPAAYLAQTPGQVLAARRGARRAPARGSGAAAHVLGCPLAGAAAGDAPRALCRRGGGENRAGRDAGRPTTAGRACSSARLLPVIRHLIGIPAGIVRMDFRWYSLATLAGSLLWCCGAQLAGRDGRQTTASCSWARCTAFTLLVLARGSALLAALYYVFVQRPAGDAGPIKPR